MSVDLEKILRPAENPLPPFPAKFVTLASGDEMVIRQVERDEIPDILPFVEPLMHVERDFYNIVGLPGSTGELLAYYMYRVQDEYVLIAQIGTELAAIVNGRIVKPGRSGCRYHTMALRRGLRNRRPCVCR